MQFVGSFLSVSVAVSSRLLRQRLHKVCKMDKTQPHFTRLIKLENMGKDEYQTLLSSARVSLESGNVIGVPTDTIYGVAASAQSVVGVRRLYDIKQRNTSNPVAISVSDVVDIYKWSKVTIPESLLNQLLPGPVTVVFERLPALNPELNPHTNLVGLRVPNHDFIRDLARTCAAPIALTSANISSQPSNIAAQCLPWLSDNVVTMPSEEFSHLWRLLDMVVCDDKNTDSSRLGSTVVDLSSRGTFRIIRPGSALKHTVSLLHTYKLSEVPTDSTSPNTTETKTDDVKADDVKTDDVKTDDAKADDAKPDTERLDISSNATTDETYADGVASSR